MQSIVTWPSMEDQASAGLHVFGFLLAAFLGARLLRLSGAMPHTAAQRRCVMLFLVAWLVLYAASVAFHLAPAGRLRQFLMAFDQGAIFILIAAGWAPLAPFRMSPEQGRFLLVLLWSMAGMGILLALVAAFADEHVVLHQVGLILYMVQATVPFLLHGRSLWRRLSRRSLACIGASMLIYSVGLVFYRMPEMAWSHVVWHLAIVLGCIGNFVGVRNLLDEDDEQIARKALMDEGLYPGRTPPEGHHIRDAHDPARIP